MLITDGSKREALIPPPAISAAQWKATTVKPAESKRIAPKLSRSETLRRAEAHITNNIKVVSERIQDDQKRLRELQQHMANVHTAMESSREQDTTERLNQKGLGFCIACERIQPQSLLRTYICSHKHRDNQISFLCFACRQQLGIDKKGILPVGGLKAYLRDSEETRRTKEWEEAQYDCDIVTDIRQGKVFYLFVTPLGTVEESVQLKELEDRRIPPSDILKMLDSVI